MKVSISVPTELSEIKLSQYQKFMKTTDGSEDDKFINRQLVGIFCNQPNEVVGKMSKISFNEIVNLISQMIMKLNDNQELIPTFKLDGVKYGFIPDFQEITLDEQADIELFLKEVKTYDKAMAVLYRPIKAESKGKYLIEDYKGDGDSLDVPLNVLNGATSFFLKLQQDLVNFTLNFIHEEVETNPKILQILERSGIGIKSITDLPKEIYSSSMKLAN
jgi:hypothetical protein